jgi:hypothetical protein
VAVLAAPAPIRSTVRLRAFSAGPVAVRTCCRAAADAANLDPLRRRAARWAADHLGELRGADPEVPGELGDRAADNRRPLLAIADLAGGEWP